MYFLQEVDDLARGGILKEMLQVVRKIVSASDVSEFGALDENVVYSKSFFGVITEVAGRRLFVWASLLEFVCLG